MERKRSKKDLRLKNLKLIVEETKRILGLIDEGNEIFHNYISSKREEIKGFNLSRKEKSSLNSKLNILVKNYKTIVGGYEAGTLSRLKDAYNNP